MFPKLFELSFFPAVFLVLPFALQSCAQRKFNNANMRSDGASLPSPQVLTLESCAPFLGATAQNSEKGSGPRQLFAKGGQPLGNYEKKLFWDYSKDHLQVNRFAYDSAKIRVEGDSVYSSLVVAEPPSEISCMRYLYALQFNAALEQLPSWTDKGYFARVPHTVRKNGELPLPSLCGFTPDAQSAVVVRGLRSSPRFEAEHTVGKRVLTRAFTSTSSQFDVAYGFASKVGKTGENIPEAERRIVEIRTSSAKGVREFSAMPDEDEYIIPLGRVFRVTARHENIDLIPNEFLEIKNKNETYKLDQKKATVICLDEITTSAAKEVLDSSELKKDVTTWADPDAGSVLSVRPADYSVLFCRSLGTVDAKSDTETSDSVKECVASMSCSHKSNYARTDYRTALEKLNPIKIDIYGSDQDNAEWACRIERKKRLVASCGEDLLSAPLNCLKEWSRANTGDNWKRPREQKE